MIFFKFADTVVSSSQQRIRIFAKMRILLKMIHPAKKMRSFLAYLQRKRMPIPRETEMRALITTKRRTLRGFMEACVVQPVTVVARVTAPITISVKANKKMHFFGMGVGSRKNLVELTGIEPVTS